MTAFARLFAPARQVLQHLRLSTQLLLIAALTAVPLIALTARTLSQCGQQLQATANEVAGAQAVSALLEVAIQTQTHRGQTNLAMSGDTSADNAVADTRPKLLAAVQAASDQLARHPQWQLDRLWQPIADQLNRLGGGERLGDRAAVFQAHTQQVAALRELLQHLGERSGLLFDPEPDTYFMMALALQRALPFTEQAGLVRGQGAGLLARGQGSPQELALFQGRVALLGEQLALARNEVAALQRAGVPAPAGYEEAVKATEVFLDRVQQDFAAGQPQGEARSFFATGTLAVQAIKGLAQGAGQALTDRLSQRETSLRQTQRLSLALAAACFLALVYCGMAFYQGTTDALRRVGAVTAAGAAGDLTQRATVPGSNEFARMGHDLDAMNSQLAALAESIRAHAHEVSATGVQLAGTSQHLSQRIGSQAAAVEQSAATLEEALDSELPIDHSHFYVTVAGAQSFVHHQDVKRLSERVIAWTFDRQVVELHVRVTLLNRFSQIGRPQKVSVADVASGPSEVRLMPPANQLVQQNWGDLCLKARDLRLITRDICLKTRPGFVIVFVLINHVPKAHTRSSAPRFQIRNVRSCRSLLCCPCAGYCGCSALPRSRRRSATRGRLLASSQRTVHESETGSWA